MAKFYGVIGFIETKETKPGIWTEEITEKDYYGDVLQFNKRMETGSGINDNINISNKISIVADPFAYENFHHIRFVVWMGTKWKITTVEIQYPRIILSIGGVYNE